MTTKIPKIVIAEAYITDTGVLKGVSVDGDKLVATFHGPYVLRAPNVVQANMSATKASPCLVQLRDLEASARPPLYTRTQDWLRGLATA